MVVVTLVLALEILQADLDFCVRQDVSSVLDQLVDSPPCAPESGCLPIACLPLLHCDILWVHVDGSRVCSGVGFKVSSRRGLGFATRDRWYLMVVDVEALKQRMRLQLKIFTGAARKVLRKRPHLPTVECAKTSRSSGNRQTLLNFLPDIILCFFGTHT